jgi:RHS repeat-associated protein
VHGALTTEYSEHTASVNTDNQLVSTTLNGAYQTFTRDANGNITADRRNTYQWDAENRLTRITSKATGGAVSQFAYDGLSRRVKQIEQTSAVTSESRLLWCGEQICARRDGSDAVTALYYAQGERRLSPTPQSLYYAQDHLGSVIATTDANGNVLGTAEYAAYGRMLTSSGTQADFGYAQMYRHAATGLYLTHYRPYDPETGRWLARDPIGEDGGLNLYAYVAGSPSNYIDADGKARMRCSAQTFLILRTAVVTTCKQGGTRCEPSDSCDVLRFKVATRRLCILAQQALTTQCFPDDPSHEQRIEDERRGIRRCEELMETACAPGGGECKIPE